MSKAPSFIVGSGVLLAVNFTLIDGVTPVAPTLVTLQVKDPSGSITFQSPITNASVGSYSFVYVPVLASPLPYHFKWEGSGAAIAVAEGAFFITPSLFPT